MTASGLVRSLTVSATVVLAVPCATGIEPVSRVVAQSAFTTLQPGVFREIHENLTINVVFVGYKQGPGMQNINEAAFRAELPHESRSLHRMEGFIGLVNPTGNRYTFDYNIVYADAAFEDSFFSYLSSIAQPRPAIGLIQDIYNSEPGRSLTIDENYWINAPAVEQWLAANARSGLGVDTTQYTVFFVNWFGRPDFKFHEYVKPGEPDPDTGRDHGAEEDAYDPDTETSTGWFARLTAWGGTPPDDPETGLGSLHRIWFHDLSAGPDYWTSSWYVGETDSAPGMYTIPVVWEYGNQSGYRPFDNLSGDLGRILRYAAINQQFTPSPIFDPVLSPPVLPRHIQLDVNLYQGTPQIDVRQNFNPPYFTQKIQALDGLRTFSTEVNVQVYDNRLSAVMDCFLSGVFALVPKQGRSCYGNRLYGIPEADLFFYHDDHLQQVLERDADYEIPVFTYAVPDHQIGVLSGLAQQSLWTLRPAVVS